jgi:hypothetical protein
MKCPIVVVLSLLGVAFWVDMGGRQLSLLIHRTSEQVEPCIRDHIQRALAMPAPHLSDDI